MEQMVDLLDFPEFRGLDVALVSVAFDSAAELADGAVRYGITEAALLTDVNHEVAQAYDVLQWAVATGEPGHTFVLVDRRGRVAWIRDYGAPQNGGVMYVPVDELTREIRRSLASAGS
jgi:peroxiredoxin